MVTDGLLHLMQVSCSGSGYNGFPGQRPIAENRCAAFFVSPVAPTLCSARCRSTPQRPRRGSLSDRILTAKTVALLFSFQTVSPVRATIETDTLSRGRSAC
jgi:hypothetical protein